MCDPAILNEHFEIPGSIRFSTASHGAVVAELSTATGTVAVARQGAQVLHWTPVGQAPVVWLSPDARFQAGKSLRGGAPVCWPWFGAHPTDAGKPGHGFARNLDWRVLETTRLRDGVRLVMGFTPGAAQQALWPHQAELTLTVTLGEVLDLALVTRNTGSSSFDLTQALHTYFHVGDIAQASVEGLDGCTYLDKVNGGDRVRQAGPVVIDGEVDRVYLGCPAETAIVDAALGRRITVRTTGSSSCVVWNPWREKGAAFGDMGTDGYRQMLCLETTNAGDDRVALAPGASHCLRATIGVAAL